jgi:hypothetical protein
MTTRSHIIIINKKAPERAKEMLRSMGNLLEFETEGITYSAIGDHVDVFFTELPAALFAAPNTPEKYLKQLQGFGIKIIQGQTPVGRAYPQTAAYNAVLTQKYFIHNLRHSDPNLLAAASGRMLIHVNQGYTRCNLLALGEKLFITSDRGIYNSCKAKGLNCHYFPPDEIQLDGFRHGFLGGAFGTKDNILFCCGSLKYHSWGNAFHNLVQSTGFSITELYDGPLVDVGSVIFV